MPFPARPSRSLLPKSLLLGAGLLLWAATAMFGTGARPAHGDATADKALAASVARGKALWRKPWRRGAKGCFACHTRGPNKMAARRLRSYPKYDKAMRRVVSVRQKINHMIKTKSGGKPLDLDGDDLTAIEAYIATLK